MSHFPKAVIEKLNSIPMEKVFKLFDCDYIVSNKGRNSRCPLPAHGATGKTPSFRWYPNTNSWSCFGCHKGGGPINFVMQMDDKKFGEAVEFLSSKFSIELEKQKLSYEKLLDKIEDKKNEYSFKLKYSYWAGKYKAALNLGKDNAVVVRLFDSLLTQKSSMDENVFMDKCNKYFDIAKSGDKYKAERAVVSNPYYNDLLDNLNLLKNCILNRDLVKDYVVSRGFGEKDFYYGVSSSFQNAYKDENGRLIFPIITPAGYVVGFTGRCFDNFIVKYLTKFSFSLGKDEYVYGLYNNWKEIMEKKEVIICEGIFDVLRLNSLGIKNAVAISGTQFTDYHYYLLSIFADNFILMFDGDVGGFTGMDNACKILDEHTQNYKRVNLPLGSDPDTLGMSDSSKLLSLIQGEQDGVVTM